ncbi:hypothetical protein, partial [Aeromonas caviae]|uniref:hypothetical protein n=1 Tax=Aeromonas caviae TaxID=648 RepID=UPI0030146678
RGQGVHREDRLSHPGRTDAVNPVLVNRYCRRKSKDVLHFLFSESVAHISSMVNIEPVAVFKCRFLVSGVLYGLPTTGCYRDISMLASAICFLDPSLMESIFYPPTMRNVLFQPIDDGTWQNAQVWSVDHNQNLTRHHNMHTSQKWCNLTHSTRLYL